MKELQELVNAKVKEMTAGGAIQEAIEKGIESAIKKAIESQFSGYGNITKQIEKLLDEKLQIDTKQIEVPLYNEVMSMAVNTKVNEFFQGQAAEKMMANLDELFKPMPKEMTLQSFVETIASHWKSEDPWDDDSVDDWATIEFETGKYSGYELKMWKKKETRYGSANAEDVHLWIGDDGKIRLRHQWNPTAIYNEDGFIVKAYASNVTLTGLEDFDADECDLTLKDEEY